MDLFRGFLGAENLVVTEDRQRDRWTQLSAEPVQNEINNRSLDPKAESFPYIHRLTHSDPFVSKRCVCSTNNIYKPAACCCQGRRPTYLQEFQRISIFKCYIQSTQLQIQVGKLVKFLSRVLCFRRANRCFFLKSKNLSLEIVTENMA